MNKRIIKIISVLLITTASHLCYGQYFQGLYDVDTSQDWGSDIFLQPDGNYLIYGTPLLTNPYQWALFNMQVSPDGSTVINKNLLLFDTFNLFMGYPGATIRLSGGGYIAPVNGQNRILTNTWAGIIKYDAAGNMVFLKTYTDTPTYCDGMLTCAMVPGGGYMVGGEHQLATASYTQGYIVRTDSLGDSIWTHIYQRNPTQSVRINGIIPLVDGRIVAGAINTVIVNPGPNSYYYNTPWYMLLDSLGNIIRDTLYTTGFQNGGLIYPDMNGGYICIGNIDTLYSSDPDDFRSFPSYIAHLDTNFRMTWLTRFPYSPDTGNRQACLAKQLSDSSYIALGDMWPNATGYLGWAAKINRNGEIVWSNSYQSDTSNFSHFEGVTEKPDGSFVFTGESFNDTLPSWHQGEDMWLVGTDSNGCENGFCAPTAVPVIPTSAPSFTIFPNPTTSMLYFTFPLSANATIRLSDITGRTINEQVLHNATGASINVRRYTPGIYLYQVTTDNETQSGKIVIE